MPIDREDLEQLDERYVRECGCAERRQDIALREATLDKAIATLNVKMAWLVGILGAIGVAVLSIAAKVLFGN